MASSNKKGVIFARYLWLYGEIISKGPISFETISNDWSYSTLNESGEPLPHKTFENHRNAIQDLFNITIECDRTTNLYYIDRDTTLSFSKATVELLNSALLFYRLQTNPKICHFIRTEHNGEDTSMVFTVLEALEERRALKIRYRHNYDVHREVEYIIHPIAVKQFRRRWYLIAELEDNSTYSFPFDRILKLAKGEAIEPSDTDIDELFSDAYGIIREPEVPGEKIILKVEREQANYFLSRPLHHSQCELERNDRYILFSLNLSPTYDFIMEVLSHGPKVEVLAPESLRAKIGAIINEMSNIYSNPVKK